MEHLTFQGRSCDEHMTNQQQLIQRYFLGELSEAEQVALEQAYFNDQRLFDQMLQAEGELVDKYTRGLLAPPTRNRFEQYYLAHPQRRERANFAVALAAKLDQANEVAAPPAAAQSLWNRLRVSMRAPKLAWAFSVALLLMAAVAVWFLIETRRLRQEFAKNENQQATQEQRERELQQQIADERRRSEQLSAELNRQRAEQQPLPTPSMNAGPTFVSLILTIGGTRSTDANPPAFLAIPKRTNQVQLQLNLRDNDYPAYRAALRSAGGERVFAWHRLNPRTTKSGASLILNLPAHKFAGGDYILMLQGVSKTGEVEDVSKSLFRVERK